MEIYYYPAPILNQKAEPVIKASKEIANILESMKNTIISKNGIGLAAPQVGISKRLVVIDNDAITRIENDNPEKEISVQTAVYKMIDPTITWHSEDHAIYQEGCLSIPKIYYNVERYCSVSVEFLDENNNKQNVTATGLLAVCIQHELDHLDGKLFIDRLSEAEREHALEEYKEIQTTRKDP